jgi:ferric-dicitrate binding protein FerR (iron transport regulator)
MEPTIDHKDLLITRYISGNATEAEKEELQRWISESPANKKIFDNTQRIWDKTPKYFTKEQQESDLNKIKHQIAERDARFGKKVNLKNWFVRAAAILVLPIMLGIGWYLGHSGLQAKTAVCEVSAPQGQISKCVLADGTQVWLNAGSTLSYDAMWNGNIRDVKLDGEAYFIVAKNKKKPFVVTSGQAQIKVLGTIFNLKAYPNENLIEATLEEGKIEFSLTKGNAEPIELKPGDQLVYHVAEKKIELGVVETYLHTAWKDGKYVFKDADLQTIVHELERLYDVKIHTENDSLLNLRFRGMFEYDQNIFSALETLERTTNLRYRMNGRDIWLQ